MACPSTDTTSVMGARRTFRARLTVPAEGHPSVALAGELDLHAAAKFKAALLKAIDEGTRFVTVDLSEVTFIDSTALGVLMGGVTRLRALDGTLDVVCPNQEIRRIFEISGLDHILDIYSTPQEELAGV